MISKNCHKNSRECSQIDCEYFLYSENELIKQDFVNMSAPYGD